MEIELFWILKIIYIYITGYSSATWGAPIRAYTSGNDAFVAKLDSFGTLLWNTFLGTSGTDLGNAITLDSSQNIYIAGSSNATWGSPIRAYTAGQDAFIAQLTSSGVLSWNTFLGGSGTDAGINIVFNSSSGISVVGRSNATWGSPIRAYDSNYDAYVARLDTSGNFIWNTFLGGSGNDQ